jgi:hypothetical protein
MLHLRALREGERFLYVDAKIDSAFYLRAAEQRRASVQQEGRPDLIRAVSIWIGLAWLGHAQMCA